MFYFLFLLLFPLLEIMVFIEVGQEIGALNTVLLIILAAVLGITLLRLQVAQAFFKARTRLARNETPLDEVFDGLCLFIAGIFLIIPGFITDGIAFLLLLPPVRGFLRDRIKELPGVFTQSGFSSEAMFNMERERRNKARDPNVIEGDYIDLTEDPKKGKY